MRFTNETIFGLMHFLTDMLVDGLTALRMCRMVVRILVKQMLMKEDCLSFAIKRSCMQQTRGFKRMSRGKKRSEWEPK